MVEKKSPYFMKRYAFLLWIFILLLATGTRFYQLEAQSFWNDEGNSARLSERSVAQIIEGTASDIHPPLYYLMLRGWRELVGEHEFGLRSLSTFAGVLTVAATMAVARLLTKRRRVAVVAGLLMALSPPLVYYSQETRMYSLLACWAILATLFLLLWQRSGKWHWLLACVLSNVAGLYTHYFYPVMLGVESLLLVAVVVSEQRDGWRQLWRVGRQWLLAVGVTVLLYVPWLPIFLQQGGGGRETAVFFTTFTLESFHWLLFGHTIPSDTLPSWSSELLVILLAVGFAKGRWIGSALLLIILAPIVSMFVAGTVEPQFLKFLVMAVPFLAILLAWGVADNVSWRFVLGVGLLCLLSWPMITSLRHLYSDPAFARVDYRGMATRIEMEAHPNAGIILDAPNQWEVFTYYHTEGAPVYPLPRGHRAEQETLYPELTTIAEAHDRVYAIFWGEAQRDPERLVERWLDENAFKATDEWVGDVRFVTYAVPAAPATTMATAVSLPFGEAIQLNGYTLPTTTLHAGDIVQVTLFWQTAVVLEERYKIFLHLVDSEGNLIAQRDSEPGGGLALTNGWVPDEVVIDNHGVLLPAATPAGSYQLLLGLYDIADPTARLPITVDGVVMDTFAVATITVE